MAVLSVLYKLFIFYLILKENLVKSFMFPDIHIRFKHGNSLINFASRTDVKKFKSTKLTNILCPAEAKGTYPYPFSHFGYIVCFKRNTNLQVCSKGKVYNFIFRKCMPIVKLRNQPRKNLYLYSCPPNDQHNHFYPYDARKYVQCHQGRLTVMNCLPWEIFSIRQRRCLPETQILRHDHVPWPATNHGKNHSNVPVVAHDRIVCPVSLFGLFPHPFSNEKYLKCVEGRLYDKSCGSGFVYDFMSKLCVKNTHNLFHILPALQNHSSSPVVIETQINDNSTFLRCPEGVRDTFVHPFSCSDYIHCSPAGTQINRCPSGQLYSFRKSKCEREGTLDKYDHVPCMENDQGKAEEDSPALGVFCAPTGTMNYPHPQSQHKYVNCNNGELQVKRCPINKIYNLDELKCVAESTAEEEEDSDE